MPPQKRKKKFDKTQFVINIILCILPIIALGVYFSWYNYQVKIIDTLTVQLMGQDKNRFDTELLQKVELLNKANDQGDTLLMRACRQGRGDVVVELLEMGANPNYHPRGTLTPLELYCKYGYRGGSYGLYKLLQAGASPNIYTEEPPLHALAMEFKWMEKEIKEEVSKEIKLLLQAGATMKWSDTTIVHCVAKYNFSDVLYDLIRTEEGIQYLMEKDSSGYYPYDLAVRNGAVKSQRVIRELDDELTELAKQNNESYKTDVQPTEEAPEENKEPEKTLEELLDDLANMKNNSETTIIID